MKLLIKFYVLWLAVFAAVKALFMLCNLPADGLTAAEALGVFVHGLPLDLATAGYLAAPLWLAQLVGLWLPLREPVRRRLYVAYVGLLAPLLALILLGDICLYPFWGIKLDATVWNYLSQPQGAVSSVGAGYLAGVTAAFVALGLGLFFAFRALPGRPAARRSGAGDAPRARAAAVRPLRPRLLLTLAMLLAGGLLFLGIRGGIGRSTANVGMAYHSERLFLNHAAVNPAFSLIASSFKSRDFASLHDYFPEAERARLFAGLGYDTFAPSADTLLTTPRPNVLLVIMEGCGAPFVHAVDSLASPAVTPRLNALAREGIVFTNMYANSFRTDRGTVSTLSGYPAFPDVSVMKLPGKVGKLPGIAASLRAEGYETQFLYGGDINFTGTNGYLLATGYDRTYGDTSFPARLRRTHGWGVTDKYLFERLLGMIGEAEHRRIAAESRTAAPSAPRWHIGALTLASHEPWGVPYARIKGDTVANSMAYLDHCIGTFVDSLRHTPAWKNLLLVLIPDHGIPYASAREPHDIRRSHIPMIWAGGAVRAPRRITAICNQSDLAATLLGQMGIDRRAFRFSRDVTAPGYRPSAFHAWSEGIYWLDPTGVSVINLLTRPPRPLLESPAPSRARRDAANAFLQTAYDDLGAL